MKLMKKRADVKVYAAVGHDFEDENNTGSYNAPDATDASVRTRSFLARYLKDEKEHSAGK
jgi:dienelactone hydrolase